MTGICSTTPSKTLHLSTNPRKRPLRSHWVLESAAPVSLGARKHNVLLHFARLGARKHSVLLHFARLGARKHKFCCTLLDWALENTVFCCTLLDWALENTRSDSLCSTTLQKHPRSHLQSHLRSHCTCSNSLCSASQAPSGAICESSIYIYIHMCICAYMHMFIGAYMYM